MAGGKLNLKFVDDAYKRLAARTGGGKFWRPEQGANRIRILPFPGNDGDDMLYFEKDTHFLGKGKPEACTGVDCVHCVRAAKMRASDDEGEKERGRRISATTQYKMLILDRNKPEGEQKVILYDACASVAKAAVRLTQNPEYGVETFCHDERGRDLLIQYDKNAAPADKYVITPASSNSGVPEALLKDIINLEATGGVMMASGDVPAKAPKKEEKVEEKVEGEKKQDCYGYFEDSADACGKCKGAAKCKEDTPGA